LAVERKLGITGPAVATALALCVLVGLGTWQLQRLSWKEDLVARIEARLAAPPAPLPPQADWSRLDLDVWEYRPVSLRGRFDHAREARVYTVLGDPKGPLRGPGYLILTPFLLADGGGIVIVNRGFVPESRADPASRAEGQVEGETTVTGLLRGPEARNSFTPDDEPTHGLFFARDPAPIAEAYGLVDVAPFGVDAGAGAGQSPGGLPQGGETRVVFPNRHLEYALTWYGLALALASVFIAFVIGRRRQTP
jgi:surfeit locus 1 family protein